MTMSFTDPGEVVLTGQNPYMILFGGAEGPPTTLVSLWHVLYSPAGEGSALFVKSEVTGGQPRIYTDNIALARFVQTELYANNAVPFGLLRRPGDRCGGRGLRPATATPARSSPNAWSRRATTSR